MLSKRIENLKKEIAGTLASVGRQLSDLKIVAVSKTFPASLVREAHATGLCHFGENYVSEATAKQEELEDLFSVHWHFIGGIQSNKVKQITNRFALIHTVSRLEIAKDLARISSEKQDILIQVNLIGENTKSGVSPGELSRLIEQIRPLEKLNMRGLMFMSPLDFDIAHQREFYEKAQDLFEKKRASLKLSEFNELSMGTSHDYKTAIEYGATIVRLGSVIFGARS